MCQTYFSFSAPGSVSHSAQKVISVYFLARFKIHLFVPWEICLGTSLEHSLSCLKVIIACFLVFDELTFVFFLMPVETKTLILKAK